MAIENYHVADGKEILDAFFGEQNKPNNCGECARFFVTREAAWKRERENIVDAVAVLRDGMCLHCDMQQQCAEGEDGISTTCNAMAIVNNFINRYKKLEVSDEGPF